MIKKKPTPTKKGCGFFNIYTMKQFFVYAILYNNKTLYIGRTNNIHRRKLEHNRLYRKGKDKLLYDFLRTTNFNGEFELVILNTFSTITESKRYELYLILQDHFTKKQFKQKIPAIRNR